MQRSACVHSDETSGHEPDFPITFSYFQEKWYKNSTIRVIYTRVLIILNTIVYAKGQPVCIQTKHQDTSQTFPLHLVIFRKNSTNIYPCTNNIKHDSLCKGSACVHSDETSGHEPDFPITFSTNNIKHELFQEKQYKYVPCTNNLTRYFQEKQYKYIAMY